MTLTTGKNFRSGRWIAALTCCVGLMLGGTAFADDKTKEVEAGKLKLTAPEGWKFSPPSSQFRLAQAVIPPMEGDKAATELVITHFGAGGAGSVEDNIARWKGQFEAQGRSVKVYEGSSANGKYVLLDQQGTWNKAIGAPFLKKTERIENARRLCVILMTEEHGDFFMVLGGPEKTVAGTTEALRKSFGAKISEEKERKK